MLEERLAQPALVSLHLLGRLERLERSAAAIECLEGLVLERARQHVPRRPARRFGGEDRQLVRADGGCQHCEGQDREKEPMARHLRLLRTKLTKPGRSPQTEPYSAWPTIVMPMPRTPPAFLPAIVAVLCV